MTIDDRCNDSNEVIERKPVPALLGAFAKLRQATISFVLPFLMEKSRLPLERCSLNFIFEYLSKIYLENPIFY